jgi:hypothetical protein
MAFGLEQRLNSPAALHFHNLADLFFHMIASSSTASSRATGGMWLRNFGDFDFCWRKLLFDYFSFC